MNEETPLDEAGGAAWRGVLVIILVGIGLGLAYNQLLLAAGPKHGLAWIKQETKLASLEDVTGTVVDDTANATPERAPSPTPAATTAEPSQPKPSRASAPAAPNVSKPSRSTGAAPAATSPGTTAQSPPPAPTQAAPTQASPPAATTKVALPVIPETREPLEVQYATIKKFWDANAAVFVDARTAGEYAEGHIPGAFNLPFDDVFADPDKAKNFNSGGKPIITYCGGGDCELSKSLASAFIDGGHKKVLVFMGGMPDWKNAGNPVTTGATSGSVSP